MEIYKGVEEIVHNHRCSGALCSVQRIESAIKDKEPSR